MHQCLTNTPTALSASLLAADYTEEPSIKMFEDLDDAPFLFDAAVLDDISRGFEIDSPDNLRCRSPDNSSLVRLAPSRRYTYPLDPQITIDEYNIMSRLADPHYFHSYHAQPKQCPRDVN